MLLISVAVKVAMAAATSKKKTVPPALMMIMALNACATAACILVTARLVIPPKATAEADSDLAIALAVLARQVDTLAAWERAIIRLSAPLPGIELAFEDRVIDR